MNNYVAPVSIKNKHCVYVLFFVVNYAYTTFISDTKNVEGNNRNNNIDNIVHLSQEKINQQSHNQKDRKISDLIAADNMGYIRICMPSIFQTPRLRPRPRPNK